jgi:hypothetical protein
MVRAALHSQDGAWGGFCGHEQIDELCEAVAATFRVAGEQRRPVLVDLRLLAGETRAARLYFVSDEAVARYSAAPRSGVSRTFQLSSSREFESLKPSVGSTQIRKSSRFS